MELALVGAGHIHMPGFVKELNARKEQFSVKYVWDHDSARAEKYAEELGAIAISDLALVWSDASIPAVIICSETNRQEVLVHLAAAAGKAIFAEKPLGMGAADGYSMATAIEKAGVMFHTGYFMRGFAELIFLREQITAGSFGQITRIRGSNCHYGSLKGWFDDEWRWMADPRVAGVGAFGDLGTHSLDIMIWLLGRVSSVTATVGVATGHYGDCDEFGEGMMRFENGAVGTLASSWVDIENPITLLISGTKGHAFICRGELFFNSELVEGADGKTPWKQLPEYQSSGFKLYLDKLAGLDVPGELVTAREAAYRSAVMGAMYEGAKKQTWVAPVE